MKAFLIGVALGAVLVVLAPLIVQQMSGLGTVATPSPRAAALPSRSATSSGVAAQIAAVDRALVQASQTRKAVPVTLTFTERDLTLSAAAYFPQTMSGVTLTDPVVHLRAGQITLDMTATAAFLRGTATVVAVVGVINGRPSTTIVSATIGGAQLPSSVTADIKTQLDQALSVGLPAKFQVTTIAVGDGTLTVAGVANP